MTRVRMGFHRMTGQRDDWLRLYIDAVRPPLVKFFDNFPRDLAAYCRERGVSVVGRVYFDNQSLGAAGGRRIDRVVAASRACPEIDIWELDNEDHQSGNDLARYSDLSIEFMQAINAVGCKAAIGSFSTGTLDIAEWARFLPALKHAAATSNFVALHEYGGGPIGMKWGVGRNQWNNGQPVTDDDCERAGLLGWWVLRYRRAVVEWRRLGMGAIPRIVGTEGGLDDIQPRPGHPGKGYKDYIGEHPPHVGDYADQWAWASRRYSEDDYFYGAVDFGWATADPQWSSFDVATDRATFDRLLAEGRELRGAGPDVPTPPPPPPTGGTMQVVNKPAAAHSDRGGQRPRYVIVHSTDAPAGSTPAGTADYFQDNALRSSIHELITPGVVYVMVPDARAAHHAGAPTSTLPDGTKGSAVNLASWGIEIYQVHGLPCDPVLVELAAVRTADACRRLGIPWDHVLMHRETDPTRRSDPVGVNAAAFRGRVAELLGVVPPAPPAPPPAPGGQVDFRKVVFALESGVRLLEGEGRMLDAAFIRSTYLADAIKLRDRK